MAAFPWGAVASTGLEVAGNLLGGLLGKKGPSMNDQLRKQYNWQTRYDLNRPSILVEGAKAAGIHPLVVFGAPTGGGFAAPVPGVGGPGIGDAVGGALSAAGVATRAYSDRKEADSAREDAEFQMLLDRLAQQKRDDVNERLVNAQVQEMQSRTIANNVRSAAIGGPIIKGSAGANEMVNFLGDKTDVSGRDTAQDFSDQYGDVIGEMYGVGNWIRDHIFGKSGVKFRPRKSRDNPFTRGTMPPLY